MPIARNMPARTPKWKGTRYALLRNEFLDSEKSPAAEVANGSASTTHASARRKKILVTLGGSDPTNVTTKLLLQLERLSSPIAIRVLIGAANPNHASLLKLAMQSQHQIDVRCSVSDMPEQFRWADAIVSAGGSSCWEWMYYGLDAGIVAIAENQLPIYDELVGKRIAIGLARLDEPIHIQSLQRFIDSVDINNHSPKRYRKWIDGYGADRIAAALDTTTWLRCTTQDDMRLYFDWANDPSVRQNSLQTKEIRWEEHCEWFTSQLNRDDRKLLVAIRQEAPIGQIRFSKTSTGMWDVAFSVAAEARGQGTGQEIIRLGTAWMRSKGLFGFTATVKRDNIPSARCFEKLNWRFIENSDKELLCFQLP
jgi:UDP-2,4-diacetamido-2,4,6-trideoxy-beta-L-altropyranose hydrolase